MSSVEDDDAMIEAIRRLQEDELITKNKADAAIAERLAALRDEAQRDDE